MLVGLHDAEKDPETRTRKRRGNIRPQNYPNYALMKISAFHKSRGDIVEWWDPLKEYDRVYSSKVFDFTPENPYLPECTIRGGTGYRDIPINAQLPAEIEEMPPDYSIYPACDFTIGYITRGCTNHCRWCVVPRKEGDIKPYRRWEDLVRPDSKKLVLMDNNILSSEYGLSELERLIDSGYSIDLNQGMDARLVTERAAQIIARLHWIRFIRFSCDQTAQIDAIFHAAALLAKYGIKPYRLFVYLLVTKDIENAAFRVEQLKRLKGISLYAQPERNEREGIIPNAVQKEFAQRFIYGRSYLKESWLAYCKRNDLQRRFPDEMETAKKARANRGAGPASGPDYQAVL